MVTFVDARQVFSAVTIKSRIRHTRNANAELRRIHRLDMLKCSGWVIDDSDIVAVYATVILKTRIWILCVWLS